ncbi:MAG: hypothetical protein ABR567_18640 [Myxococcales bacterium]|nr:hypothetical protein [Myxococcales bacterium]
MDLDIRVRHRATADPQGAREHIAARLRGALRRMNNRLAWVVVHLDDVNGPRGGNDKRCVVRAQAIDGAYAVGAATGCDLLGAVDRGLRRALDGLRLRLRRRRRR